MELIIHYINPSFQSIFNEIYELFYPPVGHKYVGLSIKAKTVAEKLTLLKFHEAVLEENGPGDDTYLEFELKDSEGFLTENDEHSLKEADEWFNNLPDEQRAFFKLIVNNYILARLEDDVKTLKTHVSRMI